MDPITAFSLACGVIQVLDFSTEALKKCKEIYKHGNVSNYQDLEEASRHLSDLDFDIRKLDECQGADSSQMSSEGCLFELATNCSTTANHLLERLNALKVEGSHRKRQAVIKVVRTFWEKKVIKAIQKRLDDYRNALDTRVLISLSSRLDRLSLRQSQEYENLNDKVKRLITSLSRSPKNFEELRILSQTENYKTLEQISSEIQSDQKRRETESYRQELLDSLWFDEIHCREENIVDAHAETFEWMFDRTSHAVRPWDNFIHWLEQGRGIYWIHGKAGCGKSTIMNFLCQDGRTLGSLRTWAGAREVFVPKFFFWSGGKPMAKSTEGLLRSLIWQLLNEFPDDDRLISVVNPPIGARQEKLARSLLNCSLDQAPASQCLVGSNELEGDQDELIGLVRDLVQDRDVKVCLSSRPEREFDIAFDSAAKLRLQDLTFDDIHRFVSDRLRNELSVGTSASEDRDLMVSRIIAKIVSRASGVFLWVDLAVKDQIRGLRNGDSLEQLKARLSCLPSKIEGIYAHMLNRIDIPYRREASRFLQIALEKLLERSHSTQRRITSTCVGLLECHEREELESNTKVYVDWIHRTAVDYMRDPEQGGSFLSANAIPGFDAQVSDIKAILVRARQFRPEESAKAPLNPMLLKRFMRMICLLEDRTEMPQIELCELLGRTVSEMQRNHIGPGEDTQWRTSIEALESEYFADSDSLMEASPSSPSESFHSAMSRTHSQEMIRNSIIRPRLLSFAACTGVSRYVRWALDRQKDHLDQSTVDHLLYCSLFSTKSQRVGPLHLVADLLKRGGNPNMPAFSNTIWGEYLSNMKSIVRPHCWYGPRDRPQGELAKAFSQTTIVFVEYQADLDRKWTSASSDMLPILAKTDRALESQSLEIRWWKAKIELSGLAFIQVCLSGVPDFAGLWNTCVARGAPYHAGCPIIELWSFSFPIEKCQTYKLSEQDSTFFFRLWRTGNGYASPDERDGQQFIIQASKFFDELKSGHRGRSNQIFFTEVSTNARMTELSRFFQQQRQVPALSRSESGDHLQSVGYGLGTVELPSEEVESEGWRFLQDYAHVIFAGLEGRPARGPQLYQPVEL